MTVFRSKELFRLARYRRFAALALGGARGNATGQAWSIRSPKDLYDHLSQYIVGQDRAKRILSVAVYNHYQRITPAADPTASSSRAGQVSSSRPAASQPSSSSAYARSSRPRAGLDPQETVNPGSPTSESPDAQDTSSLSQHLSSSPVSKDDSSMQASHHEVLEGKEREQEWARDGFFSSIRMPTPSLLARAASGSGRRDSQTPSETSASAGPSREPTTISEESGSQSSNSAVDEDLRRQQEELEAGFGGGSGRGSPLDDVVIEKSNVLMIGPTGTGKTLMARTLAKILDVPFASCDATSYTQAGYVGEDVEQCVLRLLQAAEYDVSRTEIGIIHIDEVDKLARRGGQESGTWGGGRDVGGEGVQQALLRLLEGTTLTLNAKPPAISSNPNPPSGGSPGPLGGSGGLGGLGGSGTKATKDASSTSSGALNGPAFGLGTGKSPSGAASSDPPGWDPNNPMNRTFAQGKKGVREGLPGYRGGSGGGSGKGETYVIDTTNILFVLSGAFVGLESMVNRRLGKGSIGFGAPLPKPGPSVETGRTIDPATQPLPLKGLATTDLQAYGLIPEFLGRLPILSTLHPLSISDLVRILVEPKNALIKQYQAMFGKYGSELRFTDKAVRAVAHKGLERGGGARGLRGVLEEVLVDAMFEVPGSSVRYCLITADVVDGSSPAVYFSRGQRVLFEEAYQAERDEVQAAEAGSEGEAAMEEDDRLRAVA